MKCPMCHGDHAPGAPCSNDSSLPKFEPLPPEPVFYPDLSTCFGYLDRMQGIIEPTIRLPELPNNEPPYLPDRGPVMNEPLRVLGPMVEDRFGHIIGQLGPGNLLTLFKLPEMPLSDPIPPPGLP